jgi:hypothetical protein
MLENVTCNSDVFSSLLYTVYILDFAQYLAEMPRSYVL